MVSVSSTAISNIDYDEGSETLTVTFRRDGSRYTYRGVSQGEYASLIYALSHGRQFNLNIRENFPFSRG